MSPPGSDQAFLGIGRAGVHAEQADEGVTPGTGGPARRQDPRRRDSSSSADASSVTASVTDDRNRDRRVDFPDPGSASMEMTWGWPSRAAESFSSRTSSSCWRPTKPPGRTPQPPGMRWG